MEREKLYVGICQVNLELPVPLKRFQSPVSLVKSKTGRDKNARSL